jgi:ATP-dependent RNA helicase RhlE
MPPPIVALTRELLRQPATINLERTAAPAVGITQAVYPVAQDVKSSLLLELIKRGEMKSALVFTRTKHRANRLADFLVRYNVACERIHGNRSQAQRTAALAGFKSGRFRILVATDIAARGIDVEALSHVINFDVPAVPEDYIHRVGRTARAEMTGDAFTFVSPEEEGDLKAIERAVGKRLPRVTLAGFDYARKGAEKLEVPLAQRIAEIRARKADDRARAKANAERRAQHQGAQGQRSATAPAPHSRPGQPSRSWQGRPAGSAPSQPSRSWQGRPSGSAPSSPSRPGQPQRSWPGKPSGPRRPGGR